MSEGGIQDLLNGLALDLTVGSVDDGVTIGKVRKSLATVCASDLASTHKPVMRLAKELIRLTHVIEAGSSADSQDAYSLLCDAIGVLSAMAESDSELDDKAIAEISERFTAVMAAGSAQSAQGQPMPQQAEASVELPLAAEQVEPPPPPPQAQPQAEPQAAAQNAVVEVEPVETITAAITDDAELYQEFLMEAAEHLLSSEEALLELEKDPGEADAIDTVFRAFHTIKGVAGFLALMDVNRLTHDAETLLDCCRKGDLTVSGPIIDLAFETIDAIRALLAVVAERVEGRDAAVDELPDIVELRTHLKMAAEGDFSYLGGSVTDASATAASPDDFAAGEGGAPEKPATIPSVGELLVEQGEVTIEQLESALGRQQVRDVGRPVGEILIEHEGVQAKVVAGAIREQNQVAAGRKQVVASVKVDTDKLDAMVNMVGELVIAQTQVAQGAMLALLKDEKLAKDMAQLSKITKDMQETAMSMRMIPVKETFQKMNRLVRDLSRKAGKTIEFEMMGEDTEVDRNMVEEISDPLVHIIRNSVDHGVEAPDDRVAAGKSEAGTVRLNAFHQGGNIVIEIRDDGRGLNREKIRAKAIEKGLVKAGDQLTDSQTFGLIFQAGFSTADKVTDISGRGVGMDVVRQNIEKLRGKVDVSSEEGKGTIIALKLPLTLAIIDGMIVQVGAQRYIIPTISIVETVRPAAGDVHSITGKGEMVSVRGNLFPLLKLYDAFSVEPKQTDPSEALVVIVESDNERCCVQVDELLGQQQVVIKSLGEQLRGIKGLSGGAILADGRIGLIIDVSSLMQLALATGSKSTALQAV